MSDKRIALPAGVPSTQAIRDPVTRQVADAFWSIFQSLYGFGPSIDKRAVFVSDLIRLGLLSKVGENLYSAANAANLASLVDAKVAEAISSSAAASSPLRFARGTLDGREGLAIGTHSLGIVLPDDAVVIWSMISINRAFSGVAGATMKLGVDTDGTDAFRADTLIADPPYQSGARISWPELKTTDSRNCSAIVSGNAVTDGYLTIDIQYTVVESL